MTGPLAVLEIYHSRPIAPTRRVALGRRSLPIEPPPGPGGLLLAGIVARFLPDVDPVASNVQFDEELRASDPRFGVRELSDLTERALARQLLTPTIRPMPSHNYLLRFATRI